MDMSDDIIHRVRMQEALKMARKAYECDEVPVGAVITFQGQVIAKAYNQVETLKDPTAHAEMIAITQATNTIGSKWLHECTLYVTLEPCSMCAGALVLSRLEHLYYGAADPKTGACGSIADIVRHDSLNHRVNVSGGLMGEDSGALLSQFFAGKRRSAKK